MSTPNVEIFGIQALPVGTELTQVPCGASEGDFDAALVDVTANDALNVATSDVGDVVSRAALSKKSPQNEAVGLKMEPAENSDVPLVFSTVSLSCLSDFSTTINCDESADLEISEAAGDVPKLPQQGTIRLFCVRQSEVQKSEKIDDRESMFITPQVMQSIDGDFPMRAVCTQFQTEKPEDACVTERNDQVSTSVCVQPLFAKSQRRNDVSEQSILNYFIQDTVAQISEHHALINQKKSVAPTSCDVELTVVDAKMVEEANSLKGQGQFDDGRNLQNLERAINFSDSELLKKLADESYQTTHFEITETAKFPEKTDQKNFIKEPIIFDQLANDLESLRPIHEPFTLPVHDAGSRIEIGGEIIQPMNVTAWKVAENIATNTLSNKADVSSEKNPENSDSVLKTFENNVSVDKKGDENSGEASERKEQDERAKREGADLAAHAGEMYFEHLEPEAEVSPVAHSDTVFDSEVWRDMLPVIIEQSDQFKRYEERQHKWVRVPITLSNGETLDLHMRLGGKNLQIKFSDRLADSMRSDLMRGWQNIAREARQRGLELQDPIFS